MTYLAAVHVRWQSIANDVDGHDPEWACGEMRADPVGVGKVHQSKLIWPLFDSFLTITSLIIFKTTCKMLNWQLYTYILYCIYVCRTFRRAGTAAGFCLR
jgi:hypothetical protein